MDTVRDPRPSPDGLGRGPALDGSSLLGTGVRVAETLTPRGAWCVGPNLGWRNVSVLRCFEPPDGRVSSL